MVGTGGVGRAGDGDDGAGAVATVALLSADGVGRWAEGADASGAASLLRTGGVDAAVATETVGLGGAA
ncbi:MAG: hypothetical protein WCS75_03455, partial [Sphingomonas sp.]